MNQPVPAVASEPLQSFGTHGRLAQSFQEVFTVATRVRSNRQAGTDPAFFRGHIKQLLKQQAEDARAGGYSAEDVRLAVYAYIAFLDESVLNFGRAKFPDWAGQPLQEEIFGTARAGQTFFEHLQEVLARPDSESVADLLEVYLLCLLLGFRGRYGAGQGGELQAWSSQAYEKIQRVHGEAGPFAQHGLPPVGETPPALRDPRMRRLTLMVAGIAGFALVLFLLYTLVLGADIREVTSAASSIG